MRYTIKTGSHAPNPPHLPCPRIGRKPCIFEFTIHDAPPTPDKAWNKVAGYKNTDGTAVRLGFRGVNGKCELAWYENTKMGTFLETPIGVFDLPVRGTVEILPSGDAYLYQASGTYGNVLDAGMTWLSFRSGPWFGGSKYPVPFWHLSQHIKALFGTGDNPATADVKIELKWLRKL